MSFDVVHRDFILPHETMYRAALADGSSTGAYRWCSHLANASGGRTASVDQWVFDGL